MRIPRDNPADFLTRILPFVEADGARNLNEISRSLHLPYQTVRFRINNLKEHGLGVLAIPDFEKLGLERVRAFFKLSRSIKDVKPFFGGLHQSAGLKIYARMMDQHIFDCEFAIPAGSLPELERLFEKLEQMKLVDDARLKRILWKNVPTFKSQYFDYSKGEWDVDFSKLTGDPKSIQIPTRSRPARIDYKDLLLIKELELNPWIKTIDLSRKVELQVGDVTYHLNNHVLADGLIKSFRLKWDGTKEAWLKHSIVPTTYVFDHLSDEDARHAMSILTSLPFIWSHLMTEDGTYLAETLIPVPQYSEVRQYISNHLRDVDLSPSQVLEKDWSCLSTFTIPRLLFDRNEGTWSFNADHALEYTLQMIKVYSN